jgi:hypothetical protein
MVAYTTMHRPHGNTGKLDPPALRRLLKRQGLRLEVGQPFPIQGGKRFMCIAKLVGRPYDIPRLELPRLYSDRPAEPENTQTLCVVCEEADTADEAHRLLLARLGDAYKAQTVPPRARPRRGWLQRLIETFK